MLTWRVQEAVRETRRWDVQGPGWVRVLDVSTTREVKPSNIYSSSPSLVFLVQRPALTGSHSDILAELDLPASGISRSEGRIELPRGRFTLTLPDNLSAPTTQMMFYYSAQVHLRKVLNRVHTDLYKAPSMPTPSLSTLIVSSHLTRVLLQNKVKSNGPRPCRASSA